MATIKKDQSENYKEQCIHIGINIVKGFLLRNFKHFCQKSKVVAVASSPLHLTECISE